MLRIIAFGLCLLLASPTFAYTDRVVTWQITEAQGRHYFMPPAECLVGPLPAHKIYYLSQAEMNRRWPTGDARNPDRYGMTFFAHSASNPFDYAVTFLTNGLPPKVRKDMIAHEMAHLRGCQHPGYVTHSDGTPAR